MDWARDQLPEYLWICALALEAGLDFVHQPYYEFLDAVDDVWPQESKSVALGFISDFGQISEENREKFLQSHDDLISSHFRKPVGRLLAYYPECPSLWMVGDGYLEATGHLDPETDLSSLRKLVRLLLPGKDDFAARLRTLPLGRLLKHGKVKFLEGQVDVDAMSRYPTRCTPDEKWKVESLARQLVNVSLMHSDIEVRRWAKYFWRKNYSLTVCRPSTVAFSGGRSLSEDEGSTIQKVLENNTKVARDYLKMLPSKLTMDLYDPVRDEVLCGLFARVTRLYVLMLEDVNLWARDTSGIMLRCIADTAISYCYLVRCGTAEDFKAFVEYGEGQTKLLMLHLQDTYPEDKSLEGLSVEELSQELGGTTPEFLSVELGHWTKKDTRRLARDAGMERLYRLVFNPTSGDLHGTWWSLRGCNLSRCVEPLHRFHQLPSFSEPPFFPVMTDIATEVFRHCLSVGLEELGYPDPIGHTCLVVEAIEDSGMEEGDPESTPN